MKITLTLSLRKLKDMNRMSISLASMLAVLLLLPLAARAQFAGSSETITIDGTASSWSGHYYVGNGASSDALNIINGGSLTLGSANYLYIGNQYGDDYNSVTVDGTGSQLNVLIGALYVGWYGSNNTMTVSNGGAVNGGAWGSGIGQQTVAHNNTVVVTDPGSTWATAGMNFNGGSSGNLSVLNGGAFSCVGTFLIGNVSSSNTVTVSGANGNNSTFTEGALLQLGSAYGSTFVNNALMVGAGGTVLVQDVGNIGAGLDIGPTPGATGNKVQIDGGTLLVSSSGTSTPAIHVMDGAFILNSGTVTTEALVANTGAASVVTFNGGTLTTGSTAIANSSVFTVGDGTSLAKLVLNGGSHSFANGLTISNNATLSGNGTITSGVAEIVSGGSLAIGSNVGTLTVAGLTLDSGAILNFHFGLGSNDLVNVTEAGGLTINGGGFNLYQDGTTTAFDTPGTYSLLDYAGTLNGAATNFSVLNAQSGFSYTFSAGANTIDLTIAAVPEPASFALLAMGGAVMGLCRRNRKGIQS